LTKKGKMSEAVPVETQQKEEAMTSSSKEREDVKPQGAGPSLTLLPRQQPKSGEDLEALTKKVERDVFGRSMQQIESEAEEAKRLLNPYSLPALIKYQEKLDAVTLEQVACASKSKVHGLKHEYPTLTLGHSREPATEVYPSGGVVYSSDVPRMQSVLLMLARKKFGRHALIAASHMWDAAWFWPGTCYAEFYIINTSEALPHDIKLQVIKN
jgi:hypothetical protein